MLYLGTSCERRQVFFLEEGRRKKEKCLATPGEQIESQETNSGGEYAHPLA